MNGEPTLRAAVIGFPVAQSLSPAIHAAAFAESGRVGAFDAIECKTEDLSGVVARLRNEGVIGFSVTMPLKEAMLGQCDTLDDSAAAVGAVNCVAHEDGLLVGYNTDGEGCCDALEAVGGARLDGAIAVVLGAGGTSRAVSVSLARRGAKVVVVNRTQVRAREVVELVRKGVPRADVRIGDVSTVRGADVVVNTTSVGMGTVEMPCDPSLIDRGTVVLDAVYHPIRTALLEAAEARGARCVDGLWMLVHQAKRQQEIWFSSAPQTGPMRDAALTELEARRQ